MPAVSEPLPPAEIARNIAALREELAGYPQATLVAVSKTFPAAAVRAAATAGARHFGENYLQEAADKIEACADLNLTWHFIGGVQQRKAAKLARLFDWVHSVDSEATAQKLATARAALIAEHSETPPLNIFLQVNISGEASKSGAKESELPRLAEYIQTCEALHLRGLMALPAPTTDHTAQQATFQKVAALQENLKAKGHQLDSLSLGMSADYPAALRAGSTHLRIGSQIFGTRQKPAKDGV